MMLERTALAAAVLVLVLPYFGCSGRTELPLPTSPRVLCVSSVEAPRQCTADGSQWEWGTVPVSQESSRELAVSSVGVEPLTIDHVAVAHETTRAHLFDAWLCDPPCSSPRELPLVLQPGESIRLHVRFEAAIDGLLPAEVLEVGSDDTSDSVAPGRLYRRVLSGQIEGCVEGWTDANEDIADGCECQATGHEESCDGEDNDCNGLVDDSPTGSGTPCESGLVGVCALGTFRCVDGAFQCVPDMAASVEVCDGQDNDCDGSVDEENSWFPYNEGMTAGRIQDVGYDPRWPGVAYVLAGNRVYRSTDHGATFQLAGESASRLYRIAFPPDRPDVVLATSAEGLRESADDGSSWTTIALGGLAPGSILVHPANPQRVFVGTTGAGIFRSNDGGLSFGPASQGLPYSYVTTLNGDPTDPDVALAGVIMLNDQNGWLLQGQILRTSDGGASWQSVFDGVGRVFRIERCPDDPQRLFAAVHNTGLAKSQDGGLSWTITALAAAKVTDVALGATACSTVYANIDPVGVHRSIDGGTTFTGPWSDGMSVEVPGSVRVAVNPSDVNGLLAGTHGSAFVSSDGGTSWAAAENIHGASVRSMAVPVSAPERLWMATWGQGVWARDAPAVPWRRIAADVLPRDWSSAVAASPTDSSRIFVGAKSEIWRTEDGGASFAEALPLANAMAFAFHPTDGASVYAATQLIGVQKSSDGGQSWQEANLGLPDPWPTGPGTMRDIRAIAVDSGAPDIVYLGTNGRGVFRSTDAGSSWNAIGPQLEDESITCLLHVPGSPGLLYACVAEEGIWRSDDGGQSFTLVSQSVGTGSVSGLIIDDQTGELYATTGLGVFRSTDGVAWQGVDNRCLPLAGVGSPAIVDDGATRLLVVGTGGAGVLALQL